jgi:hypothetical protein
MSNTEVVVGFMYRGKAMMTRFAWTMPLAKS